MYVTKISDTKFKLVWRQISNNTAMMTPTHNGEVNCGQPVFIGAGNYTYITSPGEV